MYGGALQGTPPCSLNEMLEVEIARLSGWTNIGKLKNIGQKHRFNFCFRAYRRFSPRTRKFLPVTIT